MIVYINPSFGNDATARFESREFPFKTHQAVVDAIKAAPPVNGKPLSEFGHSFIETHKKPPVSMPAAAAEIEPLPVVIESLPVADVGE